MEAEENNEFILELPRKASTRWQRSSYRIKKVHFFLDTIASCLTLKTVLISYGGL